MLFDPAHYETASKMIRVSFDAANCIFHENATDEKVWILNPAERKELCEVLTMDSVKYSGYSNWDAAKFDWNNECLGEQLNLKRYLSGEYDAVFANDARYVPNSLKMPDYSGLIQ